MPSRIVETPNDLAMLVRFLEGHKLPMTVEIAAGKHRTNDQNDLAWQWYTDISRQLGDRPEDWRGYCKLHFGVAIKKAASPKFAKAYDEDIRPLPYELKLKLMKAPHEFPVTSKMTTKQMTAYLDDIQRHFSEQGVVLTDPEAMKYQRAA